MLSQTPVFTYVRLQKKYLYQGMPPTNFEPMTPAHQQSYKQHGCRGPTNSQCALCLSEQNIVYKFKCARTRASTLVVSI